MKFARKAKGETGFTLLEVLIASAILAVVAVGVLGLFSVAVLRNSSAGDHGTRVTEYGQDKMEQLMALSFSDTASDTTTYPTAATGGNGLTAGGNMSVTTPASGYVDYINYNGTPSASSSHAAYIRLWQISDDISGSPTLKTITVRVQKIIEVKGEMVPYTVLVCQKSSN
jgi:prepilin-type N-terminal cleavage/methylation domain-containing protein